MTPYTFRRTDSWREQANHKGGRPARCTLNFRDRYIFFSTQLAALLGLNADAHVAFTYDEDKPENIFVRSADFSDDTQDIQLCLSTAGRNKSILRCSNRAVVNHVLTHAGATKSCTCYVALKPTRIKGKDHFQILVSCPITTK